MKYAFTALALVRQNRHASAEVLEIEKARELNPTQSSKGARAGGCPTLKVLASNNSKRVIW